MISKLLGQKDENEIALGTGCTACICVIDEKNKKIYFVNAGVQELFFVRMEQHIQCQYTINQNQKSKRIESTKQMAGSVKEELKVL